MEKVGYMSLCIILLIMCALAALSLVVRKRHHKYVDEKAKFVKGVISAIDGVVAILDGSGTFLEILNNTLWDSVIDRSKRYELKYFVSDEEELRKCLEIVKRVLSSGVTERTKVKVNIRGREMHFKVSVVKYEEGRLLVSMIDDTAAEKSRLEETRHRLAIETILNEIPVSITVKNLSSGQYLIWNKKASLLWHVDGKQMVGKFIDWYPVQQVGKAVALLEEKACKSGAVVSEVIDCTLENEEHQIFVNKLVLPFLDEEQWVVSTAVDVTDLVEKERIISELNKKMMMVHKSLKLASFSIDVRESLLDVNLSMFLDDDGKSVRQVSLSLEQFFNCISENYRSEVRYSLKQLITGEKENLSEEYKIRSITGRGTEIWIASYAIATERDKNGVALYIVGGANDITKRKKLEIELERDKILAQQASKQKSAYLANMSHDIRTPLNAIIGFSGIMAEMDDRKERDSLISIIKSNSDILLRLIDDILDISKIEAGTLAFSYTNVNINQLFDELQPVYQMKMAGNVSLVFEKPLEECIISTDRSRLTQVLTNFVTNAVKFTSKGTITVGYDVQNDKKEILLYVKDTGCGISQDNLKVVFDRFVRLNTTAAGTGLGLSISSLIVEAMGGRIGAESKENEGSTFWFTLPYKKDDTETTESFQVAAPQLSNIKTDITILIAEDNESNYLLVSSILKQFKLIHAWNGEEAVNMTKAYNPDVILMDIMMPIMDGYQAMAAIREFSPEIPIIAVTAYASSEDKKKIEDAKFSGFVAKPVNSKVLINTIIMALKLGGGRLISSKKF